MIPAAGKPADRELGTYRKRKTGPSGCLARSEWARLKKRRNLRRRGRDVDRRRRCLRGGRGGRRGLAGVAAARGGGDGVSAVGAGVGLAGVLVAVGFGLGPLPGFGLVSCVGHFAVTFWPGSGVGVGSLVTQGSDDGSADGTTAGRDGAIDPAGAGVSGGRVGSWVVIWMPPGSDWVGGGWKVESELGSSPAGVCSVSFSTATMPTFSRNSGNGHHDDSGHQGGGGHGRTYAPPQQTAEAAVVDAVADYLQSVGRRHDRVRLRAHHTAEEVAVLVGGDGHENFSST